MGGGSRQGPIGTDNNQPAIDYGTEALIGSPTPGICLIDDELEFNVALDVLEAEIANAGFTLTWDSTVRTRYDNLLKQYRKEILARVKQGQIAWTIGTIRPFHPRFAGLRNPLLCDSPPPQSPRPPATQP